MKHIFKLPQCRIVGQDLKGVIVMPQPLKPKEKLVLDFIAKTMNETGYAPSVRDICTALGIKSTSTVQMYIEKLEAKGYIVKEAGKSRTLRLELPGNDNKRYSVPVIGQVAAGTPILTVENFDGYIDYSTERVYEPGTLFALRVKGESMKDIGVLSGDIVIVEKREYADNGEIVVAMIEDEATVKRFFREDGRYRLQPENSEMEPIYTDTVSILGKVVALARYY